MPHRGISKGVVVVIVVVLVVAVAGGAYALLSTGSQKTSTLITQSQTSVPSQTPTQSQTSTSSQTSTQSQTSTTQSQTVTQSTTTSSSTSTVPPGNSTLAEQQLNGFVAALNSRDVTGVAAYYRDDAVVNWTANPNALAAASEAGIYKGSGNIKLLYATTISNAKTMSVVVSNLQTQTRPGSVTLSFQMAMSGNSSLLGEFNGTITASQVWVPSGGTYQIASDNWYYSTFNTQNHILATVFPQWGLSLQGRSPDLASEHVVEWKSAPVLAAVLYVSLVFIGIYALWVRRRKQNK